MILLILLPRFLEVEVCKTVFLASLQKRTSLVDYSYASPSQPHVDRSKSALLLMSNPGLLGLLVTRGHLVMSRCRVHPLPYEIDLG